MEATTGRNDTLERVPASVREVSAPRLGDDDLLTLERLAPIVRCLARHLFNRRRRGALPRAWWCETTRQDQYPRQDSNL